MGVDDRRLAAFEGMLKGEIPGKPKPRKPVELSAEVQEALNTNTRLQTYLAVVRECKDDMGCYVQKLKSANQDEQVKALAVLGRGRFSATPAIMDALFQAFRDAGNDKTDNRRFSAIGITRLGKSADGKRLVEMSDGMDEKELYWKEELFALGQAVSRRQ